MSLFKKKYTSINKSCLTILYIFFVLTDIGGGSRPSILDNIRCALETSIFISFGKKNYTPLNYHEAFYLATLGSAKGNINLLCYNNEIIWFKII